MSAHWIALIAVCAALLVIAAVGFASANRDIDRIYLEELTDDKPFDDLRFRRETDVALAILQPDSELLPAEENDR